MSKWIILIQIIFISLSFILNGCIEEKNDIDKKIIIVDDDFNPMIEGWGIDHFKYIQDAINAVDDNVTIKVEQGHYYENLIINKNLTLIGDDSSTTIIDGNGLGDVIYINRTVNARISGFNIRNSGVNFTNGTDAGIDIRSNNNNISDNNITNNKIGIFSIESQNNYIINNIFESNSNYGIFINAGSDFNMFINNIFSDNNVAIRIKGSKFNEVKKNIIKNNFKGVYFCCGAIKNLVYYNIFINNTVNGDNSGTNYWDNGVVGNYYDTYPGIDSDNDGIGDSPLGIGYGAQDNFPIMDIDYILKKW